MQFAIANPALPLSPNFNSRQPSPLPVSSTSAQGFYPTETRAQNLQDSRMSSSTAPPVLPAESTDPMYAGLPTYRFPAGPSRSGSAPASQPVTPILFTFPSKPALPEAPPADTLYEDRMHFSPATSPVPSLQTSSSTLSSIGSTSLLKPALPIITFPNAPMPDYEVENVYPSGMVSNVEMPYTVHQEPLSYQPSPVFPSTSQWAPLSPIKPAPSAPQLAPQTPSRFPDFSNSNRLDVDYSPAHTSPSTYLPSSAYLPSTGTFAGPPISTGNIPRSAPSTPLGRQDARFVGKPGWPAQSHINPFPFNLPQTEPRVRTDFGQSHQSYYAQPTFSPHISGYYSADEQEQDMSSPMLTMDGSKYGGSTDSRYIPYARSTKGYSSSARSKRSPPRALDLNASKKAKRVASGEVPTGDHMLPFLTEANMSAEPKVKQVRCRIACSACRKTRLKCKY